MDYSNAWSDQKNTNRQLDVKKAQVITLRKNTSAVWRKIGLTQIFLSVMAIVCGSLTLYYSAQDMGAPFNIGGPIYPGLLGLIAAVLSLVGSRLAVLENRITPSRKMKYMITLYFGLAVSNVFFSALSLILALWRTAICVLSSTPQNLNEQTTENKNDESKQHCFSNRNTVLSLAIIDVCISLSLLLLAFIGICFVFRFGKPYGFRKMDERRKMNGVSSNTCEHRECPGLDNDQLLTESNESKKNDSLTNSSLKTSGLQSIFEARKNALKSPSMVDLFNTATSDNSTTTGQSIPLQKRKSVSTSALVLAKKRNVAFNNEESDIVFAIHKNKMSKPKKVAPISQMRSKSAIALYQKQSTDVSDGSDGSNNGTNMEKIQSLANHIPVSKTSRRMKRKQQGPMSGKRSASAIILNPCILSSSNSEHDFNANGQVNSTDDTVNSQKQLLSICSTSDLFSTVPDFHDKTSLCSACRLPPLQDHKSVKMKNTVQSIEVGENRKSCLVASDSIPVIKTQSHDEDGETESDSYTHNDSLKTKKNKKVTSVNALKKFKSMQDMFTTKVINGPNRKRVSSVMSLSNTNNTNSGDITSYEKKINKKKMNFINVSSAKWGPDLLTIQHNVGHIEIPFTGTSMGGSRNFTKDVIYF